MPIKPSGKTVSSTVLDEHVRAFIPNSLPPTLQLKHQDYHYMEKANRALGRLDGITRILPDTDLFIYPYVRKEALLSSQIEGTQSSLSDLLMFENTQAPGMPLDDVREVSNYVRAMDHGLLRLQNGFPLSLRLIREIHGVLLEGNRGSDKAPGEFRRTQNWIGGTRPGNAQYVPPPPDRLMECLSDLETFLHDDTVPSLIKAALVHVQFESIHPFLDGNGRVGRLLITFLLCAEEVLTAPILYLSLYFKSHREEYYSLLQSVRTESTWEQWLRFFLQGVQETSKQAVDTAHALLALFDEDRKRIESGSGRAVGSVIRVHDFIRKRPLITSTALLSQLNLARPTVFGALQRLEDIGIIREITGKERGRVYLYDRYMDILNEGTEPLER
jgi:Fic family protein